MSSDHPVLLGLQDEAMAEEVDDDGCPRWQCNKIGGMPDWMPGDTERQNPMCELCARGMALVVQVYCPLGGSPYHRTLYVFACVNPPCWNKQGSWKALRSQCRADPRDADGPGGEPSQPSSSWADDQDDWTMDSDGTEESSTEDPVIVHLDGLAVSAPLPAPIEVPCSAELEPFCEGQEPPIVVESHPEPDPSLKSAFLHQAPQGAPCGVPVFWPYYVSVIEEPKFDHSAERDAHVKALLDMYQSKEGNPFRLQGNNATHNNSEAYEKSQVLHGDQVFHKMLKRVSRCPEQVIRYQHCGQPLYVSSPSGAIPPPCPRCGMPRVFELQLMPALLHCLSFQNQQVPCTGPPVEFGTVVMSTCSQSCWEDGFPSCEEHAYVQADPDDDAFHHVA